MAKIFGFEIKRAEENEDNIPVSFAEPQNDDGAITVGNAMGGFYSTILDMEGTAKTDPNLLQNIVEWQCNLKFLRLLMKS